MRTRINIKKTAEQIDYEYIYVKCPFCRRNNKTYSIKNQVHKFPNNLNLDNRIEVVSSSVCNPANWPIPQYDTDVEFFIHITDQTVRI